MLLGGLKNGFFKPSYQVARLSNEVVPDRKPRSMQTSAQIMGRSQFIELTTLGRRDGIQAVFQLIQQGTMDHSTKRGFHVRKPPVFKNQNLDCG